MISNIKLVNCSPIAASSYFVRMDRELCCKDWYPRAIYLGEAGTYINSFSSAAPMIVHQGRAAVLHDIVYPGLGGWHRSYTCTALQIQPNRWVGYYARHTSIMGKVVCIGTFEVRADRLYFEPRVQFEAGWEEWPRVKKGDQTVEFWVDTIDSEVVVGTFQIDSITESVE